MRPANTYTILAAALLLFAFSCRNNTASTATGKPNRFVNDSCDGCNLIYDGMPADLSWTDTLPDWSQSKKMIVSGKVFMPDGKTPAPDVIIYFYHTDSTGMYRPAPGQTQGKMHGAIRGWVKTNDKGEYKIFTNHPAPYPNSNIPAHIHPVVKEPGTNEYYIDELEFDEDTLLTKELRQKRENRGGSGICELVLDGKGYQYCRRDIVLGANIPGYPK